MSGCTHENNFYCSWKRIEGAQTQVVMFGNFWFIFFFKIVEVGVIRFRVFFQKLNFVYFSIPISGITLVRVSHYSVREALPVIRIGSDWGIKGDKL